MCVWILYQALFHMQVSFLLDTIFVGCIKYHQCFLFLYDVFVFGRLHLFVML